MQLATPEGKTNRRSDIGCVELLSSGSGVRILGGAPPTPTSVRFGHERDVVTDGPPRPGGLAPARGRPLPYLGPRRHRRVPFRPRRTAADPSTVPYPGGRARFVLRHPVFRGRPA